MTLEQMINEQQMLLNTAKTQGRELTADEQARFNSLQRSIDAAKSAAGSMNGMSGQRQREGETRGEGSEGEGDGDGDGDSAQRAMHAERSRIQTITNMCRDFQIDPASYIQNGSTEDQVREAILNSLRTSGAPLSTGVNVVGAAEDKYRAAAADALLMRGGVNVETPADGARDFMGMSLRDMAIECLSQEGSAEGLNRRSAEELYSMLQRGFYNPTAAFPAILDQTIEKAYKEGHKKAAVTFDKFTKKGSLKDFKKHDNYYVAGPAGEFLEVPEGGELKHDVFGDEKLPTRQLKTYGRQFTLTRQAFINDDIGLVTSVPSKYAAAARKTINGQVFDILLVNPKIYDGAELFGSAHKNLLASGTGITQDAVQTMIMALGNQKDQFGQSIIIRPATIVCASGMEFEIYTLFNSPTINTSDNTQAVNPLFQYKDAIEVISDPTINAKCGGLGKTMPWFMFGNSADVDGIEVDYLNGQEIPNIRRMEQAGQLGFVWDIYLDWGISVMDYRGMVKNPGVKVDTKLKLA